MCSALSCGYCGAETEFSILEEAQVLADQMKKLSSQELGVFTMQVNVEELFKLCDSRAVPLRVGAKRAKLAQTTLPKQ